MASTPTPARDAAVIRLSLLVQFHDVADVGWIVDQRKSSRTACTPPAAICLSWVSASVSLIQKRWLDSPTRPA